MPEMLLFQMFALAERIQYRMETQCKRLFVALCLDDQQKDILYGEVQRLRKAAKSGNFTRRENLHLTLAFLGETEHQKSIEQALKRVQVSPFELSIGGFGRFKKGRREVCWMGAHEEPALGRLHAVVCAALGDAGFSLERRPYRPHITLGRNVQLPADFDEKAFAAFSPQLQLPVRRVSLMWSHRVDGLLTYTEVFGVLL